MVHVRFINDQETVVTVPVRPDVDRWVLAVMPVKIKLELLRDTLGVNGGRDTDAAFTQHEQDRFVHIVVDKHDRTRLADFTRSVANLYASKIWPL